MTRGGKRIGSGRKPTQSKKVILPFRVYEKTIPKIKQIQEDYEKELLESQEKD
jgi:hypothetical protein